MPKTQINNFTSEHKLHQVKYHVRSQDYSLPVRINHLHKGQERVGTERQQLKPLKREFINLQIPFPGRLLQTIKRVL